MHVWIRPENIHRLTLVVLPFPDNMETLTVFHLYLTMGYVDIPPNFFYMSETVTNITNSRWGD